MSSAPLMKRFRRADVGPGLEEGDALSALHAELVLLREENARLKAAEHDQPGLASLLARTRAHPAQLATIDDLADGAADLMVEGMVMRESLLEVCQEIMRSLAAVEAKLRALAPPDAASTP
jgi:hypothetical protein